MRCEHVDPLGIDAGGVFRASEILKDFFESFVPVLCFQDEHACFVFGSLQPFDEKKHHRRVQQVHDDRPEIFRFGLGKRLIGLHKKIKSEQESGYRYEERSPDSRVSADEYGCGRKKEKTGVFPQPLMERITQGKRYGERTQGYEHGRPAFGHPLPGILHRPESRRFESVSMLQVWQSSIRYPPCAVRYWAVRERASIGSFAIYFTASETAIKASECDNPISNRNTLRC